MAGTGHGILVQVIEVRLLPAERVEPTFGRVNMPQGRAALRTYLADVSDETKDFSKTEEWFCWAAFERLMARRCCEVWLRSTAKSLPKEVRTLLLSSAESYGNTFMQQVETSRLSA